MVARFSDMGIDIEYPNEMPPTEARRYAMEAVGECAKKPQYVHLTDIGGRVLAWANGSFVKEWEKWQA